MSTREGEQERELVGRAIAGDAIALERLLLGHYDRLSRQIGPKTPAWLQGVVRVEDILQETFIQAFRDIGKFEPRGDASFFAWLKVIAENRLRDAIRAQKRAKRGGGLVRVDQPGDARTSSVADLVDLLSDGGDTPSRAMGRRQAVQAVEIGVAELPADQRQAIRLHCLQGKTVPETAKAMGRTPAAVRGLIHRAKQTLREGLGRSSRWLSKK